MSEPPDNPTPPDWTALQALFPADELEWRIGRAGESSGRVWALALPYVTARAIQQRLDDVMGPARWKNYFKHGPDGGVLCGLSLLVHGHWVTKWDGAENTDVQSVKGGLSSSMKRAAVQWGIGRYLYALDETFAHVHEAGRFRAKTKDGKPFKWDPPQLPAWALPAARSDRTQWHDTLLQTIERRLAELPPGIAGALDGIETDDIKQLITQRLPALRQNVANARAAAHELDLAHRAWTRSQRRPAKTQPEPQAAATNGTDHAALVRYILTASAHTTPADTIEVAGDTINLQDYIRTLWGEIKQSPVLAAIVAQRIHALTAQPLPGDASTQKVTTTL
jgi:hypothetical protein